MKKQIGKWALFLLCASTFIFMRVHRMVGYQSKLEKKYDETFIPNPEKEQVERKEASQREAP